MCWHFPTKTLSDLDLERIVQGFGVFGSEPYFLPIEGSEHVVALTRKADEKSTSVCRKLAFRLEFYGRAADWYLPVQSRYPACGRGIPGFTNQQKALAEMPADLRAKIEGRTALHSAAAAYAPDGMYGAKDKASDRSMAIRFSEDARDVRGHPFILPSP